MKNKVDESTRLSLQTSYKSAADIYDMETGLLQINPEFDEQYMYKGQLGFQYTPEATLFRVWAPVATAVECILYDGPYGEEQERLSMERIADGTYEVKVEGDWDGSSYLYSLIYPDGTTVDTLDPYSKAVTINGERSAVVDLGATNPENWSGRMETFSSPTDAIIYEVHIRDFSISPTSGIQKKGKFLGMIEEGTRSPNGKATGLDYLKELGVTHVQILPMFDFCTVDEKNPDTAYNWGYDPQNYNAPEGSYATDPWNPKERIREMKQMIQGLHDAGIRVIMDVVYNHVYSQEDHPFAKTAPGYFFRRTENGELWNASGCGNDTASERTMMRKYIIDSIQYWAEEFQLDGFRFDLMGLHDVETMNAIRAELDRIDPSMILLGEGWEMDTGLPEDQKASNKNAFQMERIAHFNDALRDAVKGSDMGDGQDTGFISGKAFMEEWIAINQQGSAFYPEHVASYQNPDQMVQYVEAHDNYTLYDKITRTMPEDDEETRTKRHLLATSIVLLSQGIPFLHAGQEFLRTKQGDSNSYRSGDEINQLDWTQKDEKETAVAYVKGLIRLRKSESLFRLPAAEDICQHMTVLNARDYSIVLQLENEQKLYYLLFNANGFPLSFEVEPGDYKVLVHDDAVELDEPTVLKNISQIKAEGFTTTVILKEKD